jgi:hypothetical protein
MKAFVNWRACVRAGPLIAASAVILEDRIMVKGSIDFEDNEFSKIVHLCMA